MFGACNRLWGRLVIEELRRGGVRQFCVAPGSRSTPLVLAVAETPGISTTVHVDERGAGFFALGWARAVGMPAAVICTSGTAAANLLPSVSEAGMAGIPLIVLTADRPPELRDCGANQTLNQQGLYGRHVRWHAELPCPAPGLDPAVALAAAAQAVARAGGVDAGPVHLNLPFRKPFFDVTAPPAPLSLQQCIDAAAGDRRAAQFSRWAADEAPWVFSGPPTVTPSSLVIAAAVRQIDMARRGVVLAGVLRPDEREAVAALAAALGWPVFADVQSGLRFGDPAADVVPAAAPLLAAAARPQLAPDCVIRVGARFVSKQIGAFLAALADVPLITLRRGPGRDDPEHCRKLVLAGDVAGSCRTLAEQASPAPDVAWRPRLRAAGAAVAAAVDRVLTVHGVALTEVGVARLLAREWPADGGLFLGSSMSIRNVDMYATTAGGPRRVAANRGVSGIDGTLATAAGFAAGLAAPTAVLCGDLALLHDLNSLPLLAGSACPVTAIVVNNGGGGIFSLLPIASQAHVFERFFAARHGYTFEHAAAQFGLDYERPGTVAALRACLAIRREAGRSGLIEVVCNAAAATELRRQLDAAITAALP